MFKNFLVPTLIVVLGGIMGLFIVSLKYPQLPSNRTCNVITNSTEYRRVPSNSIVSNRQSINFNLANGTKITTSSYTMECYSEK